jgi:hypothetical protein
MRRAAVSISSNLAEPCSRSSKVDYARFVEIATGSGFEVLSQATIGRNQGFLNPPTRKTSRTESMSLSSGFGITNSQPLAGPGPGSLAFFPCQPCSMRLVLRHDQGSGKQFRISGPIRTSTENIPSKQIAASKPVRRKLSTLFTCGVGLAVAVLYFKSAHSSDLRLSVQFLAYTNIPDYGRHVGVLQISNASSFAVVRDRAPEVVFDSPALHIDYAPTGWRVLEPGETEQVMTESLTNGVRWRFVLCAQRLGDDPYCIVAEPRLRIWRRQFAGWLQSQGLRVRTPSSPLGRVFSTAWINP